jgi:putative membrane protein
LLHNYAEELDERSFALMMNGYNCGGMLSAFGGPMGSFGWLGMLIQLLFWAGILILIAWAIMRIFPHGQRRTGESEEHMQTAEEILRQRYARGEIDDKEYESKRRALLGQGA